jgi:hypothetical protein
VEDLTADFADPDAPASMVRAELSNVETGEDSSIAEKQTEKEESQK